MIWKMNGIFSAMFFSMSVTIKLQKYFLSDNDDINLPDYSARSRVGSSVTG